LIEHYILNSGLIGVTKVSENIWKARCPVCGDSKKSLTKKRFIIMFKEKRVFCHNCNYSATFEWFLKKEKPEIYDSYIKDILSKSKKREKIEFKLDKELIQRRKKSFNEIIKVFIKHGGQKNISHIKFVSDYLNSRGLNQFKHKFWYISNYTAFVNDLEKADNKCNPKSDERLVIPFVINETKEIYAMQGRALRGQNPRYLTSIFTESKGKIYNYYNLDKESSVFITEGPIDSLFLPNACALAGSAITRDILEKFKEFQKEVIFIFDTDFVYNKSIRKSVNIILDNGFNIFFPPKKWMKYKDINDIVIGERITTKDDLRMIILENSHKGILGKTLLSKYPIKKDILR